MEAESSLVFLSDSLLRRFRCLCKLPSVPPPNFIRWGAINIVLSKEAGDGGGIPEYHTDEFVPEATVCRIACVVCPMRREDLRRYRRTNVDSPVECPVVNLPIDFRSWKRTG